MKKWGIKLWVALVFVGFGFSGCSNEEPQAPPAKDSAAQSIEAAKQKAHIAVDKTAAATQSLTEKALEIQDTAKKAAADMSATLQKESGEIKREATGAGEALRQVVGDQAGEVKNESSDAAAPAPKKAKVEGC